MNVFSSCLQGTNRKVSIMQGTLMPNTVHEKHCQIIVLSAEVDGKEQELAYLSVNGDLMFPRGLASEMPKTLSDWDAFRNLARVEGDFDEVLFKLGTLSAHGWLTVPLEQNTDAPVSLPALGNLLHWEEEELERLIAKHQHAA